METEKLVSIIVPIYNEEKTLERCVNSLTGQTYKSVEILLVDDGSTDSSATICNTYAEKDPRIKSLHKSNGGAGDSRNFGIRHCKGEYLCFVDADDALVDTMVEKLVYYIEHEEVNIAGCQNVQIDKYDNKHTSPLQYKEGKISTYEIIINTLYQEKNAWGAAWAKIFKRELFHDNAFPCSNSMEDYQAVLPIMFEQEHIYYTEEALYMHFYNENSLTRRSFNPDMLQGLTVVQNLRNIFVDKGASKDILRGVDYLKFVDLVFIINALWNTDTLGTGQLIKKMYEQTKPLMLEALIYSKKKKHTLKEVVKLNLIILAVKLGRKNGRQK